MPAGEQVCWQVAIASPQGLGWVEVVRSWARMGANEAVHRDLGANAFERRIREPIEKPEVLSGPLVRRLRSHRSCAAPGAKLQIKQH